MENLIKKFSSMKMWFKISKTEKKIDSIWFNFTENETICVLFCYTIKLQLNWIQPFSIQTKMEKKKNENENPFCSVCNALTRGSILFSLWLPMASV